MRSRRKKDFSGGCAISSVYSESELDMKRMKIAIAGSSGRMGRALLEAVLHSSDMKLGAALEAAGKAHISKDGGAVDGGPRGVPSSAKNAKNVARCDALTAFTPP